MRHGIGTATPRPVRKLRVLALAAALALLPAVVAYAAPQRHTPKHGRHSSVPTDDLGRPPRPEIPGPIKFPDSLIEPLTWHDLDQWPQEDHVAALNVFRSSCRAVIGRASSRVDDRPVLPALAQNCRLALKEKPTEDGARAFFEKNFLPVRINKLGDAAGFITGYYEPIVEGSRFPTRIFTVPVYRRPPDIIPPTGTARGAGFPNTGKSMRRLADGTLAQYYERGEIENGALDGQHLEICWLKDPIDLFFIQIQGSGRIRLEDGTMLRVNYDAHNGHPYTAIGRILIERKEVPREEMSMDRIRQWMAAAPDGGKELRSNNKSYVFFRIVGLSDDREAEGAQGVPLTPGRSIAVDKALHVYGTPFYIEAELPIATPRSDTKFRRTMIAQDTGSAIVGPARADIYYGAGDEAGRIAGRFRNAGRFAMLLPRQLDPVAAGAKFPLPTPRRAPADATKKDAVASAGDIPLPRPRPKIRLRARSRV
jgi:membrane-bound lytic murein transglycosylase A